MVAGVPAAERPDAALSPPSAHHPPKLQTLAAFALVALGQLYFHLGLPTVDGALFTAAGLALFWRALGRAPAPSLTLLAATMPVQAARFPFWGWFSLAAALLLLACSLIAATQSSPTLPAQALLPLACLGWIAYGVALDRSSLSTVSALKRAWAWLRTPHGMILCALVALAALLRLIGLAELPEGLWFDEASIGLEARRILTDPAFRPMYAQGTTTPAAYIYLVALSEAVWGQTLFGVRFVSALAGVATVALSYVVGRQLFGPWMGIAAALLMAAARWDITFSRIGMQGATTPLFLLLACALLLHALRTGSRAAYAALGVAVGLSFWFYTANLLFPAVLGALLLVVFVRQPERIRDHLGGLTLALVGAALAFAPALLDLALHPNVVLDRPLAVSIFSNRDLWAALPDLHENIRSHLLMFNVEGDHNGRHNLPGAPMLDWVTATLALLGLLAALRRFTDYRTVLLLCWLGVLLLPGILTVSFEAPQSLRGIGALPAALLLAAWGLQRTWQLLGAPRLTHRGYAFALGGGALLLSINTVTYWGPQRADFATWNAFSMAETITGRHLATAPAENRVLLSVFYQNHPTVAFLSDHPFEVFDYAERLPLQEARPTSVFLAPEEKASYDLLRQYYPDARCSVEPQTPETPAVLYTCAVSAEAIQESQGWEVRFLGAQGGFLQPLAEQVIKGSTLTPPQDLPTKDYLVEVTGSLYVPSPGAYRFSLAGSDAFQLFIDEQPAVQGAATGAPLDLTQGVHNVRLLGQGAGFSTPLQVSWQPPEQALAPLPPESMFHGAIRAMGTTALYTPLTGNPEPAIRRIEPAPSIYYHIPPIEGPFNVAWSGSVYAPTAGDYTFFVEAISAAQLELDGQPLVATLVPNKEALAKIHLTQGWHRIAVHYQASESYAHVFLHWQPPGAEKAQVPPESLRPW